LNEYTGEPIAWDPNIWPGPVGNLSCTMIRGDYLVKKDCFDMEPCGICNVDPLKRLRIKGLCVDDLKKDSDFDTEFYVNGLFNERLYIRGIRASHIFLDPLDGRWTIQSLKSPGKISKLSEEYSSVRYPIGRLEWTVEVSLLNRIRCLVCRVWSVKNSDPRALGALWALGPLGSGALGLWGPWALGPLGSGALGLWCSWSLGLLLFGTWAPWLLGTWSLWLIF
jgi:hypothetical protein